MRRESQIDEPGRISLRGHSIAPSEMISKQAALLVSLFIWSSALGGPLKFISKLIGFPFYLLPKVLLVLLALQTVVLLRAGLRQYLLIAGICFLAWVGLAHRLPAFQVFFGFWALVPLFFGMFFPELVLSKTVRNSLVAVFLVSVAGEALSYVTVFPWSGMSTDFGGVASSAGREWQEGSARRLAGFTVSSIDLSSMLAVCGFVFMFRSKQFASRFALMLLVGGLILATTMKTALLAFVLACLPLLAPSRYLRIVSGVSGLLFLGLGVAIPFCLDAHVPILGDIISAGAKFETLQERFELTWPGVLAYMRAGDAGIFGMGLGSLGSATGVVNSAFVFASVDNVYLYILGTSGLLGCILILIFIKRMSVGAFRKDDLEERYRLPLLVFFAMYGMTQPLVEASVAALFFGALLSTEPPPFRIRKRKPSPARSLNLSST